MTVNQERKKHAKKHLKRNGGSITLKLLNMFGKGHNHVKLQNVFVVKKFDKNSKINHNELLNYRDE